MRCYTDFVGCLPALRDISEPPSACFVLQVVRHGLCVGWNDVLGGTVHSRIVQIDGGVLP